MMENINNAVEVERDDGHHAYDIDCKIFTAVYDIRTLRSKYRTVDVFEIMSRGGTADDLVRLLKARNVLRSFGIDVIKNEHPL